jgi:hypothetical protein
MKAKATTYFPQNAYADGYKLTIVPNATHTQAIICQNKEAVDFIQTMSAGTGIVLGSVENYRELIKLAHS